MSRPIASIAAQIPAEAAKLALATIMAAMGSSTDWNADLWCRVADAAKPVAAMAGLPDIDDNNLDGENAFNFWSSVIT